MTPKNYLYENYREDLPRWLETYDHNSKFNSRTFFQSRVVFYPGSGDDGDAVKIFGSSHSAHCFVYSDYGINAETIKATLDSLHRNFYGYKSLVRQDLKESDISPTGWKMHASPEQIEKWRQHFQESLNGRAHSYGFLEILERDAGLNDTHGPQRLAILFLGADGHAAYDALFCQPSQNAPFAVLLQDHGFGGNYSKFGNGGFMNSIANAANRFPELLLVASNTEPWASYKAIENVFPADGRARTLYKIIKKSSIENHKN